MVRSMLEALEADGPHPDYADELSLFGRFVGAWAIDNTYFTQSGPERHEAEWRFGWTLEPATADSTVISFSATRGNVVVLRGRPDGVDIEIVGESRRGDSLRWRFFEITDDSFHWHGFIRPRDGEEWRLEQEMFARRIG
jgi:hypothetical protein